MEADAPETVAALRLEVARLRAALTSALALERFWRVRSLLGHFATRAPSQRVVPSTPTKRHAPGGSRRRLTQTPRAPRGINGVGP